MKKHIQSLRIATTNKGKLREFKQVLEPLHFQVLGLDDLPDLGIIENGKTFTENALIKAKAVTQYTKQAALADDSGLEVEYLQQAPGILSARYADVNGPKKDIANRNKLLQALQGVPSEQRKARFVCALAYCVPGFETQIFFGTLDGQIAINAQGENGFGYDPIFWLPQFNKTVAELPADKKNAISHRGRALKKLIHFLRDQQSVSS